MVGLPRNQVQLATYSSRWAKLYEEEAQVLAETIGKYAQEIQHVGSTSIPGLKSKPIIDILVGVPDQEAEEKCIQALQEIGYEYKAEQGVPGRLFFCKGNEECRTHYLHLTRWGSKFWTELLLFRDSLRQDPTLVKEYADLKARLAQEFANDRKSYTAGKTEFIQKVVADGQSKGATTDEVKDTSR